MDPKQSVTTLPQLGQPFPGHEGVFAGLGTAPDGRTYIRVRLNAQPPKRQSWALQRAWAESIGAQLADRVDGAAMHALLPDLRPDNWIWLDEPCVGSDAWYQLSDGTQGLYDKSAAGGAVAVRRLFLESFNPLEGAGKRAAEHSAGLRAAAASILAACDAADAAISEVAEALA